MELIKLFISPSKKKFALAMLGGIINGVIAALLIYIVNLSIKNFGVFNPKTCVWFIVFGLFSLLSEIFFQRSLIILLNDSIMNLRIYLVRKILNMDINKYEEIGPSSIYSSLSDDVNYISYGASEVPLFLTNLFIIICCSVYLFLLSTTLFFIAVLLFCLGIIIYLLIHKHGSRYFTKSRKIQDVLFFHFRGLAEGLKELKLYSELRSLFFEKDISQSSINHMVATNSAYDYFLYASALSKALFTLYIGLLIFLFPNMEIFRTEILTGYLFAIFYLRGPVEGIIGWIPVLVRSNVSFKRLNDMGVEFNDYSERKIQEKKHEFNLVTKKISLRLKNIEYEYSSNQSNSFSLGPISYEFLTGSIYFITGGNGSGKSTFVKLLSGLYQPSSGEYFCNGMLINSNNIDLYRDNVSTIFSDFYLFKRVTDAIQPEKKVLVKKYLKKLKIDKKVSFKYGQFSTVTELSQGEKKRLSLVVSYIYDRPIMIFDEWAADQDPVFRKVFYSEILPELKKEGKIVVVISHDEQYFKYADETLHLDYGRIENSNGNM